MAGIQLPERGMPLDVTYLYDIATAINDLSAQVTSTSSNYTTIQTRVAGKQTLKTSDAKIVAGFRDYINNENVIAGTRREFSYSYESDFKFAPIVVATVVNLGNTQIGNDVSIVLNQITTSSVNGTFKFDTTGVVSLGVNFLIIGVPT